MNEKFQQLVFSTCRSIDELNCFPLYSVQSEVQHILATFVPDELTYSEDELPLNNQQAEAASMAFMELLRMGTSPKDFGDKLLVVDPTDNVMAASTGGLNIALSNLWCLDPVTETPDKKRHVYVIGMTPEQNFLFAYGTIDALAKVDRRICDILEPTLEGGDVDACAE